MTLHVINNSTNSGSSSTNEANQIHIIHPGVNVNREDILQQFTQWDNYVTSSHGNNTPIVSSPPRFTTGYEPLPTSNNNIMRQTTPTHNTSTPISQNTSIPTHTTHSHIHKVKRFPSIKSKDFTSNQELKKSKKKKKSLFHRGFLKRSNYKTNRSKLIKHTPQGPKFRNKQEFNSCLNYIDLTSLINDQYLKTTNQSNESLSQDINSILFQNRSSHNPISSQNVVLYKPQNNNIVVNKLIPRDIYLNQNHIVTLSRNNTIKRKLSKRIHHTKIKQNRRHRTINVKRSNTLPTSLHSTQEPHQEPRNDVTGVWSQYLQAVITQRIALRLTLMNSQPASTSSSLLNCSHNSHSSIPPMSTQERIKNY